MSTLIVSVFGREQELVKRHGTEDESEKLYEYRYRSS